MLVAALPLAEIDAGYGDKITCSFYPGPLSSQSIGFASLQDVLS